MAKIVDEHGQAWIVSEHREHAGPTLGGGLRPIDELSYATLSFRTPDGRRTRILRRVAPLDWRYRADDVLCLWLQIARPVDPQERQIFLHHADERIAAHDRIPPSTEALDDTAANERAQRAGDDFTNRSEFLG